MPDLYSAHYNPDVLSCLANLSNDEVFTPPQIANAMLDLLPQELFRDPNAKFLDPAAKTGVFLREIAKRLIVGLEDQIPDLQERLDHIFHEQIYGIAMTEITSLLSRRSLYCSKYPNGRYSVTPFDSVQGNVRFKNTRHRWKNGRCVFCGASESQYQRDDGLETHAYEFIHTIHPEEIWNMKFDVIIGNPPYQLNTGTTSAQAIPLYQLFVQQAKKLNPRYLSMIIQSRWFAGGMKQLEDFRNEMRKDKRLRVLVDYANAKECFPQNSIGGGVCYFLWDRDHPGICKVTNINGGSTNEMERYLDEFSVIVRYNDAVEIVRKTSKEESIDNYVSPISPFGLSTKIRGVKQKDEGHSVRIFSSEGISYLSKEEVTKGQKYYGKYKVLVSQTGAEHAGEPGKDGKYRVLTSSMQVLAPSDVCTHSYLVLGPLDTVEEAANLLGYLKTKFVRFLLLQAMTSIHLTKATFCFVPSQDFTKAWSDADLYAKYGLTDEEIAFIESTIKPME